MFGCLLFWKLVLVLLMLYKSLLLSAKAGQQYLAKGRARGATSKVGGGGGGGAD